MRRIRTPRSARGAARRQWARLTRRVAGADTRGMAAPTLTQFLSRLAVFGYRAPTPMRVEPPCTHDDRAWAVLQIPSPNFAPEPDPPTYRGMGWWRHDACEACARRFAEAVSRNDAALALRVFRGEENVGAELGIVGKPLPMANLPLDLPFSPMA